MAVHLKRFAKTCLENHFTLSLPETYDIEPGLFLSKVAVIIGGTGDIGSAIVERVTSQGGKAVIAGRNVPDPVFAEGNRKYVRWDISFIKEREKKLEECLECFGRIDIWVNCAGYISRNDLRGDFLHATEKDWQMQMDVNAKALFFLTQSVARYFINDRVHGTIIQILSIGGIMDTWQPYGISKRAGIIFTKEAAGLLMSYGIRTFGIAPGNVHTRMIQDNLHGRTLRRMSSPDKRLATKEEIANVACFLASGRADSLNGGIIVCDGGDTLL